MMKSAARIRVLIADDHTIVRAGLAALLGTEDDLEIVGQAKNGDEAIREAVRLVPDVVIMDLMMPGLDGVETTRRLRAEHPETHVLVLTTYGTSDDIAHALDAGASGALLKTADLPDLVSAIRGVASGNRILSAEIEQILATDPPIPGLSERQSDILASVTRGLSNEDIAHQLGISVARVREHLTTLFEKLGAANRAEAVAIALRKHLLKI